MAIIAKAAVPGTTPLSRETTEPIARPANALADPALREKIRTALATGATPAVIADVVGVSTADIIAIGPVVHGVTLDVAARAEALLALRAAEVHPAWCVSADLYTKHGFNIPCGDHLGEPTNIPATDSDFDVCDYGAVFPYVEIAAATKDGDLAVNVMVNNPRAENDKDRKWVAASLRPADARTFAADLGPVGKCAVAADIAGTELSATVRGIGDGWVSAVTDGGSVRLTIGDPAQELTIEALLKPDEVWHMVHALGQAADVVEGK